MIKFISYTGKYPNLCSGVFTVEIDGKEYKFGHESADYDWKNNCYKNYGGIPWHSKLLCLKKLKLIKWKSMTPKHLTD